MLIYCEALQHELKPTMAKIPSKARIHFQHELVRCTPRISSKIKLLKWKVNVLHWAVKDPDLNLIEIFWSIFDNELASKLTYSKAALNDRLHDESNNIGQDSYMKLLASIPEGKKLFKSKRYIFF